MCTLVLVVMISSSDGIVGGLILRGGVRTFFGLLTNRVVSFCWRRRVQGAQVTEPLLLTAPELPDLVRNLVLGVADLFSDNILLLLREFPGAVVLVVVQSVSGPHSETCSPLGTHQLGFAPRP